MSKCSANCAKVISPLMAASATFALKAGEWFRRGRLLMLSPDSRDTACTLSGRNSTYRPVQISGTGSQRGSHELLLLRGKINHRSPVVAETQTRLNDSSALPLINIHPSPANLRSLMVQVDGS